MSDLQFELYPAIDILGGSCVRLYKGDYEQKQEYSKSPAAMAERWVSFGAKWLHVVDLDAAKSGSSTNAKAIRQVVEVAREFGAKVQVGGGIRTEDNVDAWLCAGVARCVIGTAALQPGFMESAVQRFGGEALVVGLDGRDGRMAVRGWLEQTDIRVVDVAKSLASVGVRHALVTDVDKDGTLAGANLALTAEVQRESGIDCIASGGIKTVDDVLAAQAAGLAGAIAGRSLYDGTLNLDEALRRLREVASC